MKNCFRGNLILNYASVSLSDYTLEFRMLAMVSRWNEPAIMTTFRNRLYVKLLSKLVFKNDDLLLERLID